MNLRPPCWTFLSLILCLAASPSAQALCRSVWSYSAHDSANGNPGLAPINIHAEHLQPAGSVLASANLSVARNARVDPEELAYECLPQDGPFYEYFATNGSDPLSGQHPVRDMPGYYHSQWHDVGLRLIHNQSGQAFSRFWQRRQIQGDYNRQTGRVEFRARHFSDITLELVKLGASANPLSGAPGEGLYSHARANGYIAFQGAGLGAGLSPGCDSASGCGGQRPQWTAAIGLWNAAHISRHSSCEVRSATPQVDLGQLSAVRLQQGGARLAHFNVDIECSNAGARNSINQAQVAFLAPMHNRQALARHYPQQLDPSGNARVLLSSGYGQSPGVAGGVGIQLVDRQQNPLLLISDGCGGDLNNAACPNARHAQPGWYPLAQHFQNVLQEQRGLSRYSGQFSARLVPLAPQVSPGRVESSVTVLVRLP